MSTANDFQRANCGLLAKALEAIPEKRFDMESIAERTACGTTKCALGWAASLPYFRGLGLRLVWADRDWAQVQLKGNPNVFAEDIASTFFGKKAAYMMMQQTGLKKTRVIEKLRQIAEQD